MTPEHRDTATQTGSVSPERFARMRAIFEAAVERPASDRRGYVDGACGGDEDLAREVQRMLAAEGQGGALLDGKPPSSAPEEGRFPAGTVLAGRYRILGLLGHGGMGEVYKAFDLILNQTVALKFLSPKHISEAALVRFRNEVRIARQVSHPNVCRVYDLGMVEGLHFISMEYIDGEDLASLLRRIGRLPQDKAVEFTRKICAGLSAAHERGVLHRDLKPANVMIDGRGHVRITDFGLAALEAEIPLSDLRSGTPAYMSPEQKAGKEVTARSDLYSLGLVLHEMFTGKARKDAQSHPTELVKDLDPAIERLILRCLEEDPKRRPSSALSVAMGLPGADPIAAALAAGETPSPEMVAASQEKEGFTLRTAVLCVLATIVCLAVGTLLSSKLTLLNKVRMDTPPEVLAFRAQEVLKQLGYADPAASTVYGLEYVNVPVRSDLTSQADSILVSQQPPIIRFWYRQHVDRFFVDRFLGGQGPAGSGAVSYNTPANTEPGMIRIALDPKGRLLALDVRPREGTAAASGPDWAVLFAAAGLDVARFRTVPPQFVPPMAADVRASWVGTYAEGRAEEVRVDAAAWQGSAVFFAAKSGPEQTPQPVWGLWLFLSLLAIFFTGGPWLAWQNLRKGRADRGGAATIGWAAFFSYAITGALLTHHVLAPWELYLVVAGVSAMMLFAGTLYVSYLAVEPYARKHWPDSLISWTRLRKTGPRDVLIASHVLAGVTATVVWYSFGARMLAWLLSARAEVPWPVFFTGIESGAYPVVQFFTALSASISVMLVQLVVVVVLRLLLRRLWIADTLTVLLLGIGFLQTYQESILVSVVFVAHTVIQMGILLWLFRRFGLLAAGAGWLAFYVCHYAQIVPGSWYAGRSLVVLLPLAAIAAWALWVILSDKRNLSTESAT